MPGERPENVTAGPFSRALQWSPGQMPGESAARPLWSLVPRFYFNGAPDRCPGRASMNGFTAGPRSELQWSPGQMPGESRRGTKVLRQV